MCNTSLLRSLSQSEINQSFSKYYTRYENVGSALTFTMCLFTIGEQPMTYFRVRYATSYFPLSFNHILIFVLICFVHVCNNKYYFCSNFYVCVECVHIYFSCYIFLFIVFCEELFDALRIISYLFYDENKHLITLTIEHFIILQYIILQYMFIYTHSVHFIIHAFFNLTVLLIFVPSISTHNFQSPPHNIKIRFPYYDFSVFYWTVFTDLGSSLVFQENNFTQGKSGESCTKLCNHGLVCCICVAASLWWYEVVNSDFSFSLSFFTLWIFFSRVYFFTRALHDLKLLFIFNFQLIISFFSYKFSSIFYSQNLFFSFFIFFFFYFLIQMDLNELYLGPKLQIEVRTCAHTTVLTLLVSHFILLCNCSRWFVLVFFISLCPASFLVWPLFLANYYISRRSIPSTILQHFVYFCLNNLDLLYIYSIPEKFNFIVSLFTISALLLFFFQTKYAAILTLIFVDMTYSSSMVSTTLYRTKNRTFEHNFVSQNLLRELLF